MLVDSKSDLPIFPHFKVSKLLLDSAHDAMPYYEYCKRQNITPFIDLNGKGGRPPIYKNDFTIDTDGVPICKAGCRMRRDGVDKAKDVQNLNVLK